VLYLGKGVESRLQQGRYPYTWGRVYKVYRPGCRRGEIPGEGCTLYSPGYSRGGIPQNGCTAQTTAEEAYLGKGVQPGLQQGMMVGS
jgi:hypothetical protein